MPRIHSVISPITGCSHGPNSVEPAPFELGEVARRLDHRHLQPEADAEIGNLALAREARRLDHALRAALAEPARHEDRVHPLQLPHRFGFGLEHFRVDPVELDLDIVGDGAMGHRLGQGFVAVRQMGVLADDGDRDLALGPADPVDDRVPASEVGLRRVEPEMGADFAIEPLGVIGAGHGIDRVDIERGNDPQLAQIAEQRDLLARTLRDRPVAAA